jgi:hypothetical protein
VEWGTITCLLLHCVGSESLWVVYHGHDTIPLELTV